MGEKPYVLQGTLALMVLKTVEALGPLHGYGIARRIEQTSGDLLSLMLNASEGGERLTQAEVLSLAKLLLVAGACAAFTMPVAIGLLHAQSQFEVASIRPHQGPLHRVFDFSSSGPRLRLEGYSAPLLIMEAYNLKSYQVSLASVPGVLEAAGEGAILAGQAEPHCECSMAVSGDGMA